MLMQKETSSDRVAVCHGRLGRVLVPRPSSLVPRYRRAFTFTEVMFAVILLGIGFIMLAGMFPVAIQQTQTTVEESNASTLVQAATRYLEQTLTQQDLPPTGNPNPIVNPPSPARYPG